MYYGRRICYTTKSIKENPELGTRLEKISKEENLDDYSKGFLESLTEFYNKKGGLSEKQLASFEKIESRFSPQEKAKFELWKQEYFNEHLEDTKIVAKYYSRTGYYQKIASRILNDEKYIPSKDAYQRMTKNKYALKVLEATKATPKFGVNNMVQVRSTAGNTGHSHHLRSLRSRLCFVLANDLTVVNSTAGSKRYKILPMGETQPIDIDERHLMKPNKKGKSSKWKL